MLPRLLGSQSSASNKKTMASRIISEPGSQATTCSLEIDEPRNEKLFSAGRLERCSSSGQKRAEPSTTEAASKKMDKSCESINSCDPQAVTSTQVRLEESFFAASIMDTGRPPFSSMESLVLACGGKAVISRILIANNGNAAIKAIRSLRQWSFCMIGDDKAIQFVVMATSDDIEANAEYISEGDYLVEVPSGSTNNNYSNLYLIVQIAEEYDCDAVWPGWGHASEDFRFPLALEASKRHLIWIGPSAASMLALGDKIGSTIIAQSADVPCVPWSGSHIRCSTEDVKDGQLSPATLNQAAVHSGEEALQICDQIGYPVMIKASAGGGGKGIRKVFSRNEVLDSFRQVANEVRGSPIFIMKLVQKCRHLEVQIISDMHGNTVALGSRDCSIQRRCQKIIEEGPVVTAPQEVVKQMENAAVRLCKAVSYCNAATCEFMYDLETHQVYFLEVNARLQVEHVVTEVVADLNLPAAQLQVAMGIPLMNIPDIQRWSNCTDSLQKHCIAARITAEHAEDNFRPTCGDVFELQLRTSMHVWGYFSIGAIGKVHQFADSQIGHIFACGRDRESARKHLIIALKGLTVRGEIRTNVEALLKILQLPAFIMNDTHTTWLETCVTFGTVSPIILQHESQCSAMNDQNALCKAMMNESDACRSLTSSNIEQLHSEPFLAYDTTRLLQAVLLAAAYEAFIKIKRSEAYFLQKIGQGQLPPPILVSHSSELVHEDIRFDVICHHTGPNTVAVELNASTAEVVLRQISSTPFPTSPNCSDSELDCAACFLMTGGLDGRSRRVFYKVDSSGIRATFDGATFTFTKETDPSQVRAPVSGKLSRWLVPSGTAVQKGQPYAEIEIMKIYMQLQIPESGALLHALAEGAVFKAGDPLATLEFPDGVVHKKAALYSGGFPINNRPRKLNKSLDGSETGSSHLSIHARSPNSLRTFRMARDKLIDALNGYHCSFHSAQIALDQLTNELLNPALPRLEMAEVLSVMEPQLPPSLCARLYGLLPLPAVSDLSGTRFRTGNGPFIDMPTPQGSKVTPAQRKSRSSYDACQGSACRLPPIADVRNGPPSDPEFNVGGGSPDVVSSGFSILCLNESESVDVLLKANRLAEVVDFQELHVRQMFDVLEDYLITQAAAPEGTPISRLQLEPLTDVLRRHEKGLLSVAADMFIFLLTLYLDVEEIFHQKDDEVAAKILLQKRTEVDASRLAVLARSHQAISQRNQILVMILGRIRQISGFNDILPLFSESLQRLSDLSKPEYSSVSLRARQLLLTRRQRSFVERTISLVDSLFDFIERRQPIFGTTSQSLWLTSGILSSPTTIGGRLLGHTTAPMTPLTNGCVPSFNCINLPSTGGVFSGLQSAALGFSTALPLGTTNSSLIQFFVSDLEEVGNDSLIALLGHPCGHLRKIAMEIFIRRHYERWALHDIKIHSDGECWVNPLVGVQQTGTLSASDEVKPLWSNWSFAGKLQGAPGGRANASSSTPSRWGFTTPSRLVPKISDALIMEKTGPSDYRTARMGGLGTGTAPLWSLADLGSLNWKSAGTPQLHSSRPKFFESTLEEEKFTLGPLPNSATASAHFIGGNTTNSYMTAGLATGRSQAIVSGISNDENDQKMDRLGLCQRKNRLLAVWTHNAVLTQEFLAQTCDIVSSARSSLAPRGPPVGVSPIANANTLTPEFQSRKVSSAELFRPNLNRISKSLLGLDSDSRLHHMLNAFSGMAAEPNDQPTGKSQMTIAMAFSTFEQFRSSFATCLEEYGVLSHSMPPAPPGVDGKLLMIFISEVAETFIMVPKRLSDEGVEAINQPEKGPLNLSAQLSSEVKNNAEKLDALGIALLGFAFLQGRQLEDLHSELHKTGRLSLGLLDASNGLPTPMAADNPTCTGSGASSESVSRPYRRHLTSEVAKTNHSPMADAKSNNTVQRSLIVLNSEDTHSQYRPHVSVEANAPELLHSINEVVENTLDGCAPSSPSIQPDVVLQLPKQAKSEAHASNQSHILFGKAALEEAFSDFGLVGSTVPRFFYFRNLTAIPPFIIDDESEVGYIASRLPSGSHHTQGNGDGNEEVVPDSLHIPYGFSSSNNSSNAHVLSPQRISVRKMSLKNSEETNVSDLAISSSITYGLKEEDSLTPCIKLPNFEEEILLRNVNCTEFAQLELKRLINFNVNIEPTTIPNIHMFEAYPKREADLGANHSSSLAPTSAVQTAPRYFIRILLHSQLIDNLEDCAELERHFVAALNALEIVLKSNLVHGSRPSPANHILMSVVLHSAPPLTGASNSSRHAPSHARLSPTAAESSIMALMRRYEQRAMKCRVGVVEVRFSQRSSQVSDTFVPIRLVVTNPTGQNLQIQKFVEITDPTTGDLVYSALDASDSLAISVRQPGPFQYTASVNGSQGAFPGIGGEHASVLLTGSQSYSPSLKHSGYDGLPVNTPHPLAGPLEQKRAMASSLQTVYIYDFLDLFEEAIKKQWRSCPKYFVPFFREDNDNPSYFKNSLSIHMGSQHINNLRCKPVRHQATTFLPDRVLESVELRLDEHGEVEQIHRSSGLNECGMVAWEIVMRTPEFPRGRRIILIGNDVTYHMGTFGVQEDLLFQRVSEMARKQGIPRIYIAVNSGARMGLAAEVQKVFRVEWLNSDEPSEGFKYLYVTAEDYKTYKLKESIAAEPIHHPIHGRIYRITTVIGAQLGLGVENLCGSGAIAGETSRAYKANMTITFVTGRTVGIGAYITRLGQRVIQKVTGAPILLTGYQALNRLIGRDVYCSNDAIGGVDVMARNGVTHLTVTNDIEGCEEILRWLSYVPEHREGPLPIMVDPTDPITRPVAYKVQSFTEDPRLMLTGCVDGTGRWNGGILDRGSFFEVLGDWAKSVIVGRGRLGGIPIGVICVETRVTESVLPADPAMMNSVETKLMRAGQVWFPDSAYKTAQGINDFNYEEIPLLIFANWRGFSGGQRDMFYEVLKFGSFIVDALVDFKQPCLVYLPPKSELRGGAWVVVDPRINSSHMEMYADPDSRGGVLEPTGTVEIKFRNRALIDLATRLDPTLQSIVNEDRLLANEGVARDDQKRQTLKEKKDKRIHDLLPIYKQVAVHFADLHDTSTRMKRRAAISEIVPWERSRVYFYWRLRRQLVLFNLRSEIMKSDPTMSLNTAEDLIDSWTRAAGHSFGNPRSASLSTTCALNAQFVHWACHSLSEIGKSLTYLRRDYLKREMIKMCQEVPSLLPEIISQMLPNTCPTAGSAGGSDIAFSQSTSDPSTGTSSHNFQQVGPLEAN